MQSRVILRVSASSRVGTKEFRPPFFHYKLFQHEEIMESGLLRLGKDVIQPFNGEGDVVGWIKKVKLVAKLQKVQDLASFILLFLHGDALALYLEISNEDQVLVNR